MGAARLKVELRTGLRRAQIGQPEAGPDPRRRHGLECQWRSPPLPASPDALHRSPRSVVMSMLAQERTDLHPRRHTVPAQHAPSAAERLRLSPSAADGSEICARAVKQVALCHEYRPSAHHLSGFWALPRTRRDRTARGSGSALAPAGGLWSLFLGHKLGSRWLLVLCTRILGECA